MATSLTILVPTHDRPKVLARVWQSWLKQEGVAEIVIVNDGSSTGYETVFSEISAACTKQGVQLKIVETSSRLGAPAAKNAGLLECSSDEILTTDDDILLPDDMVARCRADRPSGEAAKIIIGPRVIYVRDGETYGAALKRASKERQPFFDMKTLTLCAWAHPGTVTEYPFVTAVALWPAELFRNGLSFFEGYGGNGYREESDPQIAAALNFGSRVYLIPDAHCFHLPPSIAYARKGGQRRGGRLWFEYWVLKNNLIFLRRFSSHLKSSFGISPTKAWIQLALARFSFDRFYRAFLRGSR